VTSVDPHRYRARGGGTIADGYLTLSWGIPLFAELLKVTRVGMTLNCGVDKFRFPSPVPVGSRVRLHASIADVGEVGKGGVQVVRAFTFEIEGSDKPARVAESLTRYYP
jgi:acyl dehydratase